MRKARHLDAQEPFLETELQKTDGDRSKATVSITSSNTILMGVEAETKTERVRAARRRWRWVSRSDEALALASIL